MVSLGTACRVLVGLFATATLVALSRAQNLNISLIITNGISGEVNGTMVSSTNYGGYGRLKTAISALVASAPAGNVVYTINLGTSLATTLFTQYFKGTAEKYLHGMLGIQLTGYTNSDLFNNATSLAVNFLKDANFTAICTNCMIPKTHPLSNYTSPYIVKTFGTTKIAFLFFIATDTCSTVKWCDENGATVIDVLPIDAQTRINQIRFVEQVDYVISLGMGAASDLSALDIATVNQTSGINVAFTIDRSYSSPQPIMLGQTAFWGVLGTGGYQAQRLDLQFWNGSLISANGSTIVAQACANDTAPTADCVPADPSAQSAVNLYSQQLSAFSSTLVGNSSQYFNASICSLGECSIGDFVTDAIVSQYSGQCDYAILNGGSFRADIGIGPISIGDILKVLPFADTVSVLKIRGKDLLDALSGGLSRYAATSFRLPQISGMRVTINSARQLFPVDEIGYGAILVDVLMRNLSTGTYDAIQMNKVYGVCTNDYMRNGGDGYDALATKPISILDDGQQLDFVVESYLRSITTLSATYTGRIMDSASNQVLIGNCSYAPVVAAGQSGTFTDYCSPGRRGISNISYVISPQAGFIVRSIEVSLSGLNLFGNGSDYVSVFKGNSTAGSLLSGVSGAARVTANWSSSLPSSAVVLFATSLTVNYVSILEKVGNGLTISYNARSACPDGFDPISTSCSPCVAGYFKNSSVSSCSPCPAGSNASYAGTPSCDLCSQPYWSPGAGSTSCAFCNASLGYVWSSPTSCHCPDGMTSSALGCVAANVSTLYGGVSIGIIFLFVGGGGFWYRRRVQALRKRAMGRNIAKTIKVTSRKVPFMLDMAKSFAFAILDVLEIGLDWYAYISSPSESATTLIYMIVVIFGTSIGFLALIIRGIFTVRLYHIHKQGVEVLQRKQMKRSRAVSSRSGIPEAGQKPQEISLSSDPQFIDAIRRLHLCRQHLSHTKFVSLPGIIKSLPVIIIQLIVANHFQLPLWLQMGAFGTSTFSLALNLQDCGGWYTTLSAYQRFKLTVDQMLKGHDLVRVSGYNGSRSESTRSHVGAAGGPPGHGKPAANAPSKPTAPRLVHAGSSDPSSPVEKTADILQEKPSDEPPPSPHPSAGGRAIQIVDPRNLTLPRNAN